MAILARKTPAPAEELCQCGHAASTHGAFTSTCAITDCECNRFATVGRYPHLDRLLDTLHRRQRCGCMDCGELGIQWKVTAAGYWELILVVPTNDRDGYRRNHQISPTLDQAARNMIAKEQYLTPPSISPLDESQQQEAA